MSDTVDWAVLSLVAGARDELGDGERGGTDVACRALLHVLPVEFIESAVDQYTAFGPGAETARSVLMHLRPSIAMYRCYCVVMTCESVETRRNAAELLRSFGDASSLLGLTDMLADSDRDVRAWIAQIPLEMARRGELSEQDEARVLDVLRGQGDVSAVEIARRISEDDLYDEG